MDCQLLTKDEAASQARITRRYLDMRIAAGTGPQVVHIGRRALVRVDDFAAWLDKLPVQSRHKDEAAEAIIEPNLSMYIRLERPNGRRGRRISLASLASLLAAGALPTGTVPPPAAAEQPPA